MCIDANENLAPLPIPDVIDAAHELKLQRMRQAINLLSLLKCNGLRAELENTQIDPPSRSWINFFSSDNELKLKFSRSIDSNRLSAACYSKIQNFFNNFGVVLRSYPRELVFGCDETMIDLTKTTKCVVPINSIPVNEAEKQIPHLTMMLAHSCGGAKVPPFILVPNLRKESPDIRELKSAIGEAWLCASDSGWQTRETFFLWTVNFAHWTTFYRAQLPPSLKKSGILLILDGHSSRQCPAALELLRAFRIQVLVLPSHCSHVLQMFDVGLAAGMKKLLTKYYRRNEQNSDVTFQAELARNRYRAIMAGIKAWNAFASPDLCKLSGKLVGLFPFDPNAVLSNYLVMPDPVVAGRGLAHNRNFLDINSRIITERGTIDIIREQVRRTCPRFDLLTFDATQPYVMELRRLYLSTQTRFPLFSSLLNVAAHPSICLEINASEEMICVHELILEMNQIIGVQTTAPLSHERFFDARYILSFPSSESFPFSVDSDSVIHESQLFRVMKANFRATREICCLKLFIAPEDNPVVVNVRECICKLTHLQSDYSESFRGLVQENGRFYLLHDYYPLTIETIIHLGIELDRNDWRLIMRQMLRSILWLASIGYIHTHLKLSSFLVSDVNTVKLGGLSHAMPFRDLSKFHPKYLEYCAPEFILGDRTHCEGYLVWNLGCLFFKMFSSHMPFEPRQTNALYVINTILVMFNGHGAIDTIEPDFWRGLPLTSIIRPEPIPLVRQDMADYLPDDLELIDLMTGMLMIDARRRWSLRSCLAHNFFAGLPDDAVSPRQIDLPECPSMDVFNRFYASSPN
jgi:serine/threonine protein kinase